MQTPVDPGNEPNDATRNRLRELFEQAIDVPANERDSWIDERLGDAGERSALRRLLIADDGRGFLDTPASEHAERFVAVEAPTASLIGQRIGAFKLVRALGQGGMAAVFLGERVDADFEQRAAIKLLRRGLYSELEQRLFQRERQVLAALDHPNIAHLIDGGVTAAGIPYLVMEYVDGVPITRHAQDKSLDLRGRLQLFLAVCRGVEAAHRSLIVHRDIKPSNILVEADGTVKLLDFGIAKLLEEEDVGATFGVYTPDYAAPEQVSGSAITTATDVYGLGVLLYELLTGSRPDGGTSRRPSSRVHNTRDAAAGNTIAPAQLRRMLRGDLDNILLRALDPEPSRRYPSAGALADDIERHLEHRPVAAHPPSRVYRMLKFIQRHRAGVATAALFLAAILAALGVVLWQAAVARREAVRANALRDFMFTAFAQAEPSVPREGPPRITDVVTEAIAKAHDDVRLNSGVRSELLTELGAVLKAQGKVADARAALQSNYDESLRQFGADDPLTLNAGLGLARTLILAGDYGKARGLFDSLALRTPTRQVGLHSELLLSSAELASKQHEIARALRDGRQGLELARNVGDEDDLAEALSSFGNVQLSANDIAGSAQTYQEYLANREHRYGPQHISVAVAHSALSRVWRRAGDLDAAEREIRAALAIDSGVLPKDDWRHANHLNALTMILLAKRDFAGALDAAQESLRIDRIAFGDSHQETANDLNNVGMLRARLENYAAAVAPLSESLDLVVAQFGPEHYETAVTRANYGVVLAHSGEWAQGEAQVRHAIASLEAAKEPDFDEIATTQEKLVRLKLDHHEAADALPVIDDLDMALARLAKPGAYWDGRSALLRAAAQMDLRDPAHALPLLHAAEAALAQSKHPDAQLRIETLLLLAKAEQAASDPADAEHHAQQGRAQLAALRNPPQRLQQLAAEIPTAATDVH